MEASTARSSREAPAFRIRRADAGVSWWSAAWRIFARAPITWIALMAIGVVVSLAADLLLGRFVVVNFVFSLLESTVFVAAVLAVARALDRRQDVTLGDVFAAFGNRFLPLIALLIVVSIGFALCVLLGAGIVKLIFGGGLGDAWQWAIDAQDATTVEQLMSVMAKHEPEAPMIALLVLLFAALFALPLLMAAWFAPALVLFDHVGPFASLASSLNACGRNVVPFLIYGGLGLVLAIVASAPVFLGWIVLAPVMMITLYTSYADLFPAGTSEAGKGAEK